MLSNFTAKYRKISSGYMGQILEWPEVVTEGKNLEECREMLEDALKEMILAYVQKCAKMCTVHDFMTLLWYPYRFEMSKTKF